MSKKVLDLLKCSTSSPGCEHLCENPIMLSCGNYICKVCLPTGVSQSSIKCNICGQTNQKDLNQHETQQAFNILFEEHLNELFNVTLENITDTFRTCKDMICNYEERIDNHIQFIKDSILLRVESVKIELDNLYDAFSAELNEIAGKWKIESKNIQFDKFDAKAFENEINKFEKEIKEKKHLDREVLYKHQKQIKQIQEIIKEYKNISPSLNFEESKQKLTKQSIGEIVYETAKKYSYDDLPTGNFNMNEFKRIYSNKELTESLPYLWQHFDEDHYSIWYCEYKYPEELKQVFMSSNLIGGMFQRLESLHKSAFASMCVWGEINNNIIAGVWLWKGRQLVFPLCPDWTIDYESYVWRRMNHGDENDRKLINQILSWEGKIDGKKFAAGKIFK